MSYTRNTNTNTNTNTTAPSKGVLVFEGLDVGFLTIREGMQIKSGGKMHDLADWLCIEGNVQKLAQALQFRPKVEKAMRDFG